MSAKKKGLGRGLDALLASASLPKKEVPTDPAQPVPAPENLDGELRHLPIEFLERGRYQPRRDMDPQALEDLAASIKAQGVMQTIVVRPNAGRRTASSMDETAGHGKAAGGADATDAAPGHGGNPA